MSIFEKSKSNSYLALGLLILYSLTSQADDGYGWHERLQIHGFLTQGYVNTTENKFFGDSETGSFEFRELGINTSYRFNPSLLVSAQLLSRTAGKMYDGSPSLDYAQIDFTPQMTDQGRLGTLFGRFKNSLGFYNDTRDVASTRPSIFVPQVIYWDRVRNTVLSTDGGMLYADLHQDMHSFYLHLYAGNTPIDENMEKTYLPAQLNPRLEQRGLSKGGRLLYEWDGGRFRMALSGASLDLDGELAGGLLSGSVDIDYWIFSSQFNQGPLSLTLEYMNEPVEYTGFMGSMDAADTTADGYYLQANYRVLPDWEILMRYEEAHYDKDDRDGSEIQIPGTLPHNFYAKMWTLGLLWEPIQNLIVRTEFSVVDGTLFLSNVENPNPLDTVKHWNMFALLVSYSF